MTIRELTRQGSWRGLGFLVQSETTSSGKKTVSHEFVNSDVRYTEELGKIPRKFTLNVTVHGYDAISQRFFLEDELNQPGVGSLVHPIYGELQAKSTTYSITSNQNNIGRFDFSINFEVSDANVTAEPILISESGVKKQAETSRSLLDDALEAAYSIPDIPSLLDSAAGKLSEVFEGIVDAVSVVTDPIQSAASSFASVIFEAQAGVFSIVQEATQIKLSLTNIYDSMLSVVDFPGQLLASWESLIDFGTEDDFEPTSTVIRSKKENNRNIINDHTRITALIGAYESAVYKDYGTETDLQKERSFLDEKFKEIFFSDPIENDIATNKINYLANEPNTRAAVSELRVKSNQVFDQKEQAIWKVNTIKPGRSSMALTAYRYYGDIENIDLLASLNPNVNVANFNEEINAVSK